MNNRARSGCGPETLLFGIGNSGRGDDGLGWAFLDRIRQAPEFSGRAEYRYQLQVEDAALISQFEHVIFVDAHKAELPGGYQWLDCSAAPLFEFTTHALSPGAVLHLCSDLYGHEPRAELLAISGQAWDLGGGLSKYAKENLENALNRFREQCQPR